jgi:hypothetical protein
MRDSERRKRDRARTFVLGGVLGASAGLATARRLQRKRRRETPVGLAAFESAPCYRDSAGGAGESGG